MSGLFKKPSVEQAPAPQQEEDPLAEQRRRRVAANRRGAATSNTLTGPQGLTGDPLVGRSSILGG